MTTKTVPFVVLLVFLALLASLTWGCAAMAPGRVGLELPPPLRIIEVKTVPLGDPRAVACFARDGWEALLLNYDAAFARIETLEEILKEGYEH